MAATTEELMKIQHELADLVERLENCGKTGDNREILEERIAELIKKQDKLLR